MSDLLSSKEEVEETELQRVYKLVDHWHAESERLRPMAESWESYVAAQERKGEPVETGADARDAARYRWLRDNAKDDNDIHEALCSDLSSYHYSAQEFDKKVDAAIAASPEKSGAEPECAKCKMLLAFEGDVCWACSKEER